MNTDYLKFLKQLLVFSAILALLVAAFTFLLPAAYVSPAWPFLIPFFIAATLLSYYYLLQTLHKRFIKFVNTFLLTILIKLVLYVSVMILYAFTHRREAVPFMLGFFLLYLCYTVFESVSIIRDTPHKPDGGEASSS